MVLILSVWRDEKEKIYKQWVDFKKRYMLKNFSNVSTHAGGSFAKYP